MAPVPQNPATTWPPTTYSLSPPFPTHRPCTRPHTSPRHNAPNSTRTPRDHLQTTERTKNCQDHLRTQHTPKNHLRDTGMTTGHNNTVSTHHAHLPIWLTHTRQPDYIAHYLLQNNNKSPRKDNLTESRPDSSGGIKNEDPQAAHKYHIYCLLPVPPDPAAA